MWTLLVNVTLRSLQLIAGRNSGEPAVAQCIQSIYPDMLQLIDVESSWKSHD